MNCHFTSLLCCFVIDHPANPPMAMAQPYVPSAPYLLGSAPLGPGLPPDEAPTQQGLQPARAPGSNITHEYM